MSLELSVKEKYFVHNTISYNAFYLILLDALTKKNALSVARAADGEKILMDEYLKHGSGAFEPIEAMDEDWLKRYGIHGITREELYRRILRAGTECTYFAPSISGVANKGYSVWDYFPLRKEYVDNFFVNDFKWEMKENLVKTAGHVLLIHGNPHTADSMQLRLQANLGVKVDYIRLTNWRDSEAVIQAAHKINAPLVLFSGGPASKYIANDIATEGNIPKVVIDLGAAAQHWTFEHLPADRAAAEKFHKEWVQRNNQKISI